jgi:hypothetical protein
MPELSAQKTREISPAGKIKRLELTAEMELCLADLKHAL